MPLKELMRPTGPYHVGTDQLDLFDKSNSDPAYPGGRLIPLQLYFPVGTGEHKPYPKILEERSPKDFPPLYINGFSKPVSIDTLVSGDHPIALFNHGHHVSMGDYSSINEELASHGCVVISIQHQLHTDIKQEKYLDGRSTLKYGKVINNLLYVFEWLKENKDTFFKGKIDTNRVALIGHSMGGNSLLSLANRAFGTFHPGEVTLLPHDNPRKTKECIVFIDGESTYPRQIKYPILFCLSAERKSYQEQSGTLKDLKRIGYRFYHYAGSSHISFMDHVWALDKLPDESDQAYFNGTQEELRAFGTNLRHDILQFLKDNGII